MQLLTAKDLKSDQEVRWCPGCGDYSILSQVQKILAELCIEKENTVFVSGIGCSSRFPYYMDTFGFHGIHGRAPTIATGVKLANPKLDVWVITGDGDALSIGGNHVIHALRRNIDLSILCFNNRIYGLTKGQYSPTSEMGKKTKTSPQGAIDYPISPTTLALGANATFVARAVDMDVKFLQEMLRRVAQHRGAAFVEIYQNCNVYNNNAWWYATDRKTKEDHVLFLEHGKPMVFGANKDKGIRLNGLKPEVVTIGDQYGVADLLVHDETDATLAYLLSQFHHPDMPEPMGVLHAVNKPTYEELLFEQIDHMRESLGEGDLETLLRGGETWEANGPVEASA